MNDAEFTSDIFKTETCQGHVNLVKVQFGGHFK